MARGDRNDIWFSIVHQIDISPLPARFIRGSLSFDKSLVIVHDGNNASVALELIKFAENGLWRGTETPVVLGDVASYSSHFAVADCYLLLGAHDDEKMRLFIAPHDERAPVMKTLSLTFAEARSRLETKWRKLHAN